MDVGWEARITAAEECRYFTAEDKLFALSWDTCAVGEIALGRGTFGTGLIFNEKEDGTLTQKDSLSVLGVRFSVAVKDDNVLAARRVYNRIQRLHGLKESVASA